MDEVGTVPEPSWLLSRATNLIDAIGRDAGGLCGRVSRHKNNRVFVTPAGPRGVDACEMGGEGASGPTCVTKWHM